MAQSVSLTVNAEFPKNYKSLIYPNSVYDWNVNFIYVYIFIYRPYFIKEAKSACSSM